MTFDLKKVLSSNMCTGCGLCVCSPSDMKIDEFGYLRPSKIINDAISRSCPGLKVETHNGDYQYHKLWGPIEKVYRGHSTDDNIRLKGSSGGVLTQIALYLLESKKVDKVIHVGMNSDKPLENEIKISATSDDVVSNAGSRYCPSAPLSVIRELMIDNFVYAIIAKPCDISAIRSLYSADSNFEIKFPYLLSFICAGIPSQLGSLELLEKLNIKKENLISLQYRGSGWPGLTTAVADDGTVAQMTYNDSWGKVLNRHLQTRCKVCADGTGESADITCGDAWTSSIDGYPSFEEDNGESLVISRTIKSKLLIDEMINRHKVVLDKYSVQNIEIIQPYQANRKRTLFVRLVAIKIFARFTTKFKGKKLFSNMFDTNFKNSLLSFLGTIKRVISNRL